MQITIDPGTNGCGWAIWDEKWKLDSFGIFIPEDCDSEKDELKAWKYKAELVMNYLYNRMSWKKVRKLYIEYPSVFGGGVAAQSGAVVKLACLVGMICGNAAIDFELIPVIKWKGQLPKDVVEKRVKKLLPEFKGTSHAVDAVGIGLYIQGRF